MATASSFQESHPRGRGRGLYLRHEVRVVTAHKGSGSCKLRSRLSHSKARSRSNFLRTNLRSCACGGFLVAWFLPVMAFSPTLKEVRDAKYKPGQVWSYKTRSGEDASTLTILRVEEDQKKRRIVHIRVDHIRLRNCTGGPEPDTAQHMPFARDALDSSVTKLLRTDSVPDYEDGYRQWREGWDAGKAGVYTVSVAAAVDVMQQSFSQGLGCAM